jgi:hypothetical protein
MFHPQYTSGQFLTTTAKLQFWDLGFHVSPSFTHFMSGHGQMLIRTLLNFNLFCLLKFMFSHSYTLLFESWRWKFTWFWKIQWNTGAIPLKFKARPSETGISLHMKVFEPHVRKLHWIVLLQSTGDHARPYPMPILQSTLEGKKVRGG